MRKERRDLEERAMKANEMVAAINKVGPLLGKVVRSHVDEIIVDLVKAIEERDEALKELAEAKNQIAELTATRQKLLNTKHEYLRIHGPLPDLNKWMTPLNDSETSAAAATSAITTDEHHHSQHPPHPICSQDQASPTHSLSHISPPHTTADEDNDWVQFVMKQTENFECF